MIALGTVPIARLTTEANVNSFPRLPVREHERSFIWFARWTDLAGEEGFATRFAALNGWREAAPEKMLPTLMRKPERLRLASTKRSQPRQCPACPDLDARQARRTRRQPMPKWSESGIQQPRVERIRALLIAGLRHHYTPETVGEIPQLWQRLAPYLGKIVGQVSRSTYGIGFNAGKSGFDYVAGVEVSEFAGVSRELFKLTIPAQRYFVFSHEGHVSEIPKTIGSIINEWAPASGYTFSAFPSILEQYGEGFDPQTGLGDMRIMLPAPTMVD